MQHARYVRLYADESGESHFQDVEVSLIPVDFAPPAPPLNIAQFQDATRCLWVGAPADWAGDTPHPSPSRQIFCVLQGRCEVTASDGEQRVLGPGSVLLLEDTRGKGHATRITGEEELLILAVATAEPQETA